MAAAALEFGGQEKFNAPKERVFEVVTNLDLLAANIPDAVSTQRVDDRTLNCTVRPGFSFLRGTMKIVVQLVELTPSTSAALRIDARGIGQSMRIDSHIVLADEPTGCLLTWNARVSELTGLVATVGKSLIHAAAGQLINDGWQKVHAQVGG